MILTAAGAPIFLTKNYVNKDVIYAYDLGDAAAVYTASSNQSLLSRVMEMDPLSYWNSATADDDNTEVINIALYEGRVLTTRTDIGLIALLNTNAKSFKIELSSNGGSTFHTTYTVTNNALENYVIDTSSSVKSANHIRITIYSTITVDAYKKVGTVVLAGVLKQMTDRPNYPTVRSDRENIKVLVMGDGSENITYIKRSAASFSFYQCNFTFSPITAADILALRTFRRANPAFLFYPEPYDKPSELYYCRFDGPFQEEPWVEYRPAGYKLSFAVTEIA